MCVCIFQVSEAVGLLIPTAGQILSTAVEHVFLQNLCLHCTWSIWVDGCHDSKELADRFHVEML